MASDCFVFGKKISFGNSRSKSNIKTRRKFSPNTVEKSFFSDFLNQKFDLRVSMRGLRTVAKHGSLDNYLLTTRSISLTDDALKLKNKIKRFLKKKDQKSAQG